MTNGSNSWKTKQETVVNVTDSGGSTLNANSLKYVWSQKDKDVTEADITTGFASGAKLSKDDATGDNWYLWVVAKDGAGNTQIDHSNAFWIDNSNPTISSAAVTNTGWSKENKTIKVTASDTGSGIAGYAITSSDTKPVDNAWKTSDTPGSWTSGEYGAGSTYYAWVKDAVGHTAKYGPITIEKIDKDQPTLNLEGNTTAQQTHSATVTIGDATSGLAAGNYDVKYKWKDNSTQLSADEWNKVTDKISITVQAGDKNKTGSISGGKDLGTGTKYLHVQAVLKDQANNSATLTKQATFNFDNQGPTITLGTTGATTWKKEQSSSVKITDNTGGSGVDTNTFRYTWNNKDSGTQENEITSTFNQTETTLKKKDVTGKNWYVWVLAKDTLGNLTINHAGPFYIDNSPPSKTAPSVTATTNSITITYKQSDSDSRIDTNSIQYRYRLETESNWSSWGTSATISSGIQYGKWYVVQTKASDVAGNGPEESDTAKVQTLDIQSPTCTPNTKNWTNEDVEVTINYPETKGATLTRQWSYDANSWTTLTADQTSVKVKLDTYGKTVYAQQIDTSNQGTDRRASYQATNIDKENPVITKVEQSDVGPTTVTLTVTASDNGHSGIDTEHNGYKCYLGDTLVGESNTNVINCEGLTEYATNALTVKVSDRATNSGSNATNVKTPCSGTTMTCSETGETKNICSLCGNTVTADAHIHCPVHPDQWSVSSSPTICYKTIGACTGIVNLDEASGLRYDYDYASTHKCTFCGSTREEWRYKGTAPCSEGHDVLVYKCYDCPNTVLHTVPCTRIFWCEELMISYMEWRTECSHGRSPGHKYCEHNYDGVEHYN